jgi:hypothetical protein
MEKGNCAARVNPPHQTIERIPARDTETTIRVQSNEARIQVPRAQAPFHSNRLDACPFLSSVWKEAAEKAGGDK